MNAIFGQRNVQLALALCLPLIAIHYFDIADLGYFVFVPVLTLAVILLSALATAARSGGGDDHG